MQNQDEVISFWGWRSKVGQLWTVQVECYAGYRGEERPLQFHLGEKSHEIIAVLDQWYGPEESYFKVRTKENETYILRHHFEGVWGIESYRRE